MTLALNDVSGAETGGLEETSATVGTPSAPTTNPRSGARAYRLAAGDAIEFAPFAAVAAAADAGTGYVVGASASFDDVTPAAAVPFLSLREGAAEFLRLEPTADGDVLAVDANGATIRTITGPFTAADRFGPVEVFGYQAWSNSGTDNGSALDLSTWDLAIGNTFTSNFARLPGG